MNARAKSLVMCVLCAAVLFAVPAFAQDQTGATVVQATHDQAPVTFGSQTPDMPKGKGSPFFVEHRVKKLPPPPAAPQGKKAGPAVNVVQSSATKSLNVSAPVSFSGISDGGFYTVDAAPSDTTGAIGSTQYVQWVNEALQIFKRDGTSAYGPTLGRSLWKGFGGRCETLNDGDPIVQYDKQARRWVLSQFAVNDGAPFLECIAVSMTDDATGKYFRYGYQFANFNDYPKVGVWSDGYYITFNMFDENDKPLGSKVCALPKDKMLTGQDAPMQCFDVADFGLLPADIDGNTPPPTGSPELLMNFTRDALRLWKLHIDWNDPTKSALTGPTTIAVAPFDIACSSGPCIKQKGTNSRLDTLSDRLMFRLAYRNFGDHDALVVNHSVSVAGGATSGVRWYEIRSPFTTPAIAQQSTYAPGNTTARWMGSLAMDKMGNILLGYSTSGGSNFPAVVLAGRSPGDPKSTLSKEARAVAGTAAQIGVDRWGDYASMTIDPIDDCTFWFTTEVLDKNHKRWQTAVVHTKFANCN
ncbi:MAG TPA: hypothetical protein VKL19_09635 [Thermoanaerobaculia bacterium]|nr:hypothetical protein [Thermoanaerobaculia bacterium]